MSATTQVAEAVPGLATPRAPQTPLRDREARLEAQRQVIETQFDLEIFLKRCELNTINEEIKRGEDLLERLKDAILNGPPPAGTFAPDIVPRLATLSTPTLPEVPMPLPLPQEHPALPPIMTEPFPILETPTMAAPTPRSVKPTPNALTASATPAPTVPDPVARNPTPPSPVLPAPMPLPLSPTSPRGKRRASARKLTGMDGSLYARRSDGVLVKIACPICDRSDFQNLQGFVNHTRISHNKSFASHDVAVRECGIELAEDGTPLNRPTGTPPLTEDEPSAPRTRPGQKAKKPRLNDEPDEITDLSFHPPLIPNGGQRRTRRSGDNGFPSIDAVDNGDLELDEEEGSAADGSQHGDEDEETDDDGSFQPE